MTTGDRKLFWESSPLSAMIDFAPSETHRRATQLSTQIIIPRAVDDVFAFFADAGNLESITPELKRIFQYRHEQLTRTLTL